MYQGLPFSPTLGCSPRPFMRSQRYPSILIPVFQFSFCFPCSLCLSLLTQSLYVPCPSLSAPHSLHSLVFLHADLFCLFPHLSYVFSLGVQQDVSPVLDEVCRSENPRWSQVNCYTASCGFPIIKIKKGAV